MTYKKTKTINSGDSLVVTHPTTNQPARSLSMAERTGSPIFFVLWSIAENYLKYVNIYLLISQGEVVDANDLRAEGPHFL